MFRVMFKTPHGNDRFWKNRGDFREGVSYLVVESRLLNTNLGQGIEMLVVKDDGTMQFVSVAEHREFQELVVFDDGSYEGLSVSDEPKLFMGKIYPPPLSEGKKEPQLPPLSEKDRGAWVPPLSENDMELPIEDPESITSKPTKLGAKTK